MSVSSHVNTTSKQWVKIITVDPRIRLIEGALKDFGLVRIELNEIPSQFRWPQEGEYWTVFRENQFWHLGNPLEDPESSRPIESLNPGDTKLGGQGKTTYVAGNLHVDGQMSGDFPHTHEGDDLLSTNIPGGRVLTATGTGTVVWQQPSGGGGGASSGFYSTVIGDGTSTTIRVNHGLGTANVSASVWENGVGANGQEVVVEKQIVDINNIDFIFDVAPANDSLKVIIFGSINNGVGVFTQKIGDGTATSFVLNHGFGTRNVLVAMRHNTTNSLSEDATWVASSDQEVTVTFAAPPALDEYTVIIQAGAIAGSGGGGGHVIQDEGVALTQRKNLNFVGSGVTATDDSANDRTVVTVTDTFSGAAAGGVLAGTYPNPTFAQDMATQAELDAHTHATLPTTGEKSALAGTSGVPADTNRYVTNADARLTDARTPLAHTHPIADVTNLQASLDAKQDAATAATDAELEAARSASRVFAMAVS